VTHESIRRWCGKLGEAFAAKLRRHRPKPDATWHLDEVVILSAKSPAFSTARIAAGNRAGVITGNRTSPAKHP
jgi:transposase-like protein